MPVAWYRFTTTFGRNAVPDPALPVFWVVLVAIGALVFAILDAVLPGLDAARTPAALTLRAE